MKIIRDLVTADTPPFGEVGDGGQGRVNESPVFSQGQSECGG